MTTVRESGWARRADRGESPQRRGFWINGEPYPVTIISTRYGGCYESTEGESATWAAFHCDSDDVPEDATGDDISCANYWESADASDVGRGATPNDALDDLKARLTL